MRDSDHSAQSDKVIIRTKPEIGFAIWRETLVDAAIFRQTIVNNSAQKPVARLAHFFCEQFYRAKAVKLAPSDSIMLPISQQQLADTLGLSLVTTNRAVKQVRSTNSCDWVNGILKVKKWKVLSDLGNFNPDYLNLEKPKSL